MSEYPADRAILETFKTQNEDRPSDHIQEVVKGARLPTPNGVAVDAFLFAPYFIEGLAQNAASVVRNDSIPEFWHISIPPKAAVTVRVYAGAFTPGNGAKPIVELTGGAAIKLQVRFKELTIVNVSAGATSTNVNVIATRALDCDIYPGSLA